MTTSLVHLVLKVVGQDHDSLFYSPGMMHSRASGITVVGSLFNLRPCCGVGDRLCGIRIGGEYMESDRDLHVTMYPLPETQTLYLAWLEMYLLIIFFV